MKVVFSRQELAAALLFASQDETRYIITGVCIEIRPGKRPLLVASDGRRLVAIDTLAEQYDEFTESHQIVLRPDWADLIVKLAKSVGQKLFPWVCIEHTPGEKAVRVSVVGRDDAELRVKEGMLMEGDYPNWRKILPKKNQVREAVTDLGINAEFVGDFAKAAKLLECGDNVIQMNLVGKEQSVEVKMIRKPNFYGLIMQCRLDESVDYQPDFLSIMEDIQKSPAPAKMADAENVEELIEEASQFVRLAGRGSVAELQRHFRLGYTRAQALMDKLEEKGVVGPATVDGSPRKVNP